MKPINKLLLLVTLLAAFAGASFGQATLTQTTLGAAVMGGDINTSGGLSTPAPDVVVTLASVTNVNAAINGSPQTYLYIDRELMAVLTVNTTTKIVGVLRGQQGTAAHSHANAAIVLVGQNGQFQATDPSGACTSTGILVTPWINVNTGYEWLCSSVTTEWVPGFANPGTSVDPLQPTAAVASATTILPTGPLFHVTGTTATATFTIPVGFEGGCFTVIADGVWTWTNAGNIQVAGTVTTAGSTVTFCQDVVTAKFYPSRLA